MTRRRLLPVHWNASGRAIPDNGASELDNVVPLRPEYDIPASHEPVHQLPPERSGRRLAVTVVALALIAVGVLVLLAPVQTTSAVAQWVGPR